MSDAREKLDAEVLAWIAEGACAPADDERFEALALALFRHQHEHNAPYRRLCAAFGAAPRDVRRWQQIPPVPTGAFKEARLACFPPQRELRSFRSSGTTAGRPSVLPLDTLALYEASLLATFRAWICPDVERIRFAVLAPPGSAAPHSSLSHMFKVAVRAFGTEASAFYLRAEGWDPDRLVADLERAREPIALVGTAFSFVHLIEALAERDLALQLPAGSRVMETGGFKGRSRELTREQLHGGIARALGLARERIVDQYGMSELASQFYEPTLVVGAATTVKRVPPWVRTRVADPETLGDVRPGERGLLVHYDLANTGSVLAVQTSDRGRLVEGGFEVFGRLAGAEDRGCSIAADALLEGA
jgi:hypothetical protein